MMSRRPATAAVMILAVLAATGCRRALDESSASRLPLPPGALRAAAEIDEETLATLIRDLSHDRMEGRRPGTEGDERAQSYIETHLRNLGLRPGAADGSYRQAFDLVAMTTQVPDTWLFRLDEKDLALERSSDFVATSGVQSEVAAIENAELVFVGYGIQAPEYDWDDFKGADLAGKVLLMMNNDPDWDPSLFEGDTRLYYGRWTYKYEIAAAMGAAGAILIHTSPSAGYPWQVVQTSWGNEQLVLPARGEPEVQVTAWVTESAAARLVSTAGFDLAELRRLARTRNFAPIPLGIRTSLRLASRLERRQSANVLGLLEGRDPTLGDEVVVYTAHFDHLGTGDPDENGDSIYNGARDNAVGVGMILAIAKAVAALPRSPRRSSLFALVGGEEQGLLGSEHYSRHPTFLPGKIAANVNIDGGNVLGRTHDIGFVGYGRSTLDQVASRVATMQGRTLVGDEFPDRGHFYRSDQFNFARLGVPALYIKPGIDYRGRPAGWGKEQRRHFIEHRYHQLSDEFDEGWDYAGMIEDARFIFICGIAVAEHDDLPTWRPGDEFESARLDALAATGGR